MPTYDIRERVDVLHAQKRAADAAGTMGFSKRACGELAIVASELASNVLKYGVSGHIEILPVDDVNGIGLSMIATDRGPPFRDLEAALQDGWDDRGPIDPIQMLKRNGIGGGLGAILRLSHVFRVEPEANGKRIVVVRYLVAPRKRSRPPATSR